jgi:outer membrane protein assembly factor BamB
MRRPLLVWGPLIALCLTALRISAAGADDWPQWRGPARDGVWRESGIVERFSSPELPIRWRAPIGSGYSGPTVAKGRVYISDRVVEPTQVERVHCFDAASGKALWSFTYDCPYVNVSYQAGPRAAITVRDGRAYALGAMGNLHCFDAADGKVLWSADLNARYKIRMPIWGIAAAPLIVDDVVILHIGGNGACAVALDAETGEERWKALGDQASYSAPILVEQAGRRVAVFWTGDSVSGLDPATGTVHWRHSFPPTKMPIGIATPIVSGDRLFVTSFYDGALMLRLHPERLAVEKLWHRRGRSERETDGLQSIISTPVFDGDHVYGVDSYGELRCLEAASGERVWEDLTATPKARWSNIHFVRNGERWWLFNERGELIIARLSPRGYDEISRAKLIEPTTAQLSQRGGVCWSHPAFAGRHVFARNDKEIVCASLEAK